VGIQALNDTDLKRLGRLHTAAEARAAFDIARTPFPHQFRPDLRPAGTDPGSLAAELAEALDMAADHLSLYQLTIEPGTAFGRSVRQGVTAGSAHEDAAADMYEITQEMCADAGLPAYEVSNHARGRSGIASQPDLLARWRLGRDRTRCPWSPDAQWPVAGHGNGTRRLALAGTRRNVTGAGDKRVEVSPTEQAEEYLMMGLRLSEGVVSTACRINQEVS
jgi:coproporphyrinogen III oxidase-like Fe-S oxidoreductase